MLIPNSLWPFFGQFGISTMAKPSEKLLADANIGLITTSPVLSIKPQRLLMQMGASPSEKGFPIKLWLNNHCTLSIDEPIFAAMIYRCQSLRKTKIIQRTLCLQVNLINWLFSFLLKVSRQLCTS